MPLRCFKISRVISFSFLAREDRSSPTEEEVWEEAEGVASVVGHPSPSGSRCLQCKGPQPIRLPQLRWRALLPGACTTRAHTATQSCKTRRTVQTKRDRSSRKRQSSLDVFCWMCSSELSNIYSCKSVFCGLHFVISSKHDSEMMFYWIGNSNFILIRFFDTATESVLCPYFQC